VGGRPAGSVVGPSISGAGRHPAADNPASNREGVIMKRMAMMIGIDEEAIERYKALHADVWPEVLDRLSKSNITNYSIFLRQPENIMFAYWEYVGTDFEADNNAISEDPKTKEWWEICGPMQVPLESRAAEEWWASVEEVFHLD
jgi:L-rhamnose mutarotase